MKEVYLKVGIYLDVTNQKDSEEVVVEKAADKMKEVLENAGFSTDLYEQRIEEFDY